MSETRQPGIQIKGINDGLLITLSEGDWSDLRVVLMEKIEEKINFFKGARVALDVGETVLRATEMSSLRDDFMDRGMTLWAVITTSQVTKQNALSLGFSTHLAMTKIEKPEKGIDTSIPGESAIFLHRTLRSGFQVSYKGHVTILGDVNPGAEVIATGSIVVWGKVRGVLHAGAEGDETAVVCAMDLQPQQLRIAGLVTVTPSRKGKAQPEMACIRDGKLIAESWKL